jgi:uncharacterized protein YjbJ (UPF0337 family)
MKMSDNAQEMKGRAKQAAGDLTDDKDLKREGQVEQAGARAKDKIDDVAERAKHGMDKLADKASERVGHDR